MRETTAILCLIDRNSNTLTRREVSLGRLSRLGVLVNSGLDSGEWIVTKGVNSLSEGQEVRILESDAEGSA